MTNEKATSNTVWQIRVRKTLDDLVDKYIVADTHSTKSEFVRQAVREKLERAGVKLTPDVTEPEVEDNGTEEAGK